MRTIPNDKLSDIKPTLGETLLCYVAPPRVLFEPILPTAYPITDRDKPVKKVAHKDPVPEKVARKDPLPVKVLRKDPSPGKVVRRDDAPGNFIRKDSRFRCG